VLHEHILVSAQMAYEVVAKLLKLILVEIIGRSQAHANDSREIAILGRLLSDVLSGWHGGQPRRASVVANPNRQVGQREKHGDPANEISDVPERLEQ
jgi:hypothetical protein